MELKVFPDNWSPQYRPAEFITVWRWIFDAQGRENGGEVFYTLTPPVIPQVQG